MAISMEELSQRRIPIQGLTCFRGHTIIGLKEMLVNSFHDEAFVGMASESPFDTGNIEGLFLCLCLVFVAHYTSFVRNSQFLASLLGGTLSRSNNAKAYRYMI